MLFFSHCLFHIFYLNSAAPAMAWLIALRYTAATTSAAMFLPGLVYLLAKQGSRLRSAALWAGGCITYYCLTVIIGDLAYYKQAGKHSTVELLLFYQNFIDISLMALRDYLYIPIAYLFAGLLFFFGWRRLVRRELSLPQPLQARPSVRRLRHAAALIVFLLVSLVAFRGGLQGRPLRPADAFVHLSQAHGDFALNGVYTSFYAISHRSIFPVSSGAESVANARGLIAAPGDRFISDELPFFRIASAGAGGERKLNVVFIILESWSAKRVGAYGDKTGATPFFDSLAQRGVLFTNAYATGRRSIASLPSALSSIPTLYGSLYITSPHEQNFQRGMGAIFADRGYATEFTYAAKAGSMGFNAFARLAGFEKILTRESFPADAAHDGVWGIYDHVMFTRAIDEMRAAKKPFLSVVYTLHPHPPFTLPERPTDFNATGPRARYYDALRYSDDSLRGFFAAAQKESWFKNTVFVLMADHAFEESQGRDSFHIPLLFYAEQILAPKRDARVASELDVLPSLIDLLRLPVAHGSMGKSLFADGERAAYVDMEHSAGVIREVAGEQLVFLFGSEDYGGYYNMTRDPQWQKMQNGSPLSAGEMQRMRDYIGVMGFAVAKNRIAPAAQKIPDS